MPSDPVKSLAGALIDGRYAVEQMLGDGGMGEVYLARDRRTGRPVAVKLPWPWLLEQPKEKDRFLYEIRALSRLDHPHIVKILDVVEHLGRPVQVMQYFGGGTLEDRHELSLAAWLPAIASALDYMHGQGLIHRDVKPGNIFLDSQATAYLGDFGIVKPLEGAPRLTQTGYTPGTPRYMAPEAVRGHELDGRADQYALAMIAYEWLAGRGPFEADTPWGIAAAHITLAPRPLLDIDGCHSVETSDVLDVALSKMPTARFASCCEFAESLLRTLRDPVHPQPVGLESVGEPEIDSVAVPLERALETPVDDPSLSGNTRYPCTPPMKEHLLRLVSGRRRKPLMVLLAGVSAFLLGFYAIMAVLGLLAAWRSEVASQPNAAVVKTPAAAPTLIPAQTIKSDLAFGVYVRRSGREIVWEEVGSTPGVVEIPECHDRLFGFSVSSTKAAAYADELNRLGITQIHICSTEKESPEIVTAALHKLVRSNPNIQSVFLDPLDIELLNGGGVCCVHDQSLDDLTFLADLRQLSSLGLDGYEPRLMEDLQRLGVLPKLRYLSLFGFGNSKQPVAVDLSLLSEANELVYLNLRGFANADVSKMPNLSRLEVLDLYGWSKLKEVSGVGRLTSLAILRLESCPELRDLDGISSLKKLTSLDLSFCKNLTDISALSNLKSLTSLNLTSCDKLTKNQLDSLQKQLSGCKIVSQYDPGIAP